jgi:6-phosphogluconolactonase
MDLQLIETATPETFVQRSADFLAEAITHATEERGHCVLGLSGGKTPRGVYSALASAMNVEWSRVYLFLIDERCVPADHEESNQRMIRQTLLRYGNVDPVERCVFPDTSLPPAECAADYDKKLRRLFDDVGTADLLVLGMGEDGHIASLFPPVPKEAFGDAYALHTTTPSAGSGQAPTFAIRDRITVTIPPLHRAHQQCFFLQGQGKKATWDAMMASEEGPERWPAKGVMAFGETTVIAHWQ